MNVFNDGCDEAFEHKLRTEHETFCKVVHDTIMSFTDFTTASIAERKDKIESVIIEAYVDSVSRLIPDAELNMVSRAESCYRTVCSNCGTSWAVSNNIPFEDWCASKPFCVKCGAKLKKGKQMCTETSIN